MGKVIKNKSYILKSNDLIQVSDNLKIRSLVKKNLDRSNFWPLPPKHLLINYRTLEIIFLYNYDSNLNVTFLVRIPHHIYWPTWRTKRMLILVRSSRTLETEQH